MPELRDRRIVFWKILRISPETTLRAVLQNYRKEFARDGSKENSKVEWEQVVNGPSNQSFSDFLKNLKETAPQAFGDRAAAVRGNLRF